MTGPCCPPNPSPGQPNYADLDFACPTNFKMQVRLLLTDLLLLAAFGINVLAAPSAGCGKTPTLVSGTNSSLVTNNKDRQFIVQIPSAYDVQNPYPLIFTFHALGGSASQIARGGAGTSAYYGLSALANGTAIFVSPNGQTTNIRNSLGWANEGGEDVAFVDAILKTVSDDLCIDTSRVFSTGFSYGAAMSYALACARADVFRAVAVMSGNPLSGCDPGTKPIGYYQQHGTNDTVLSIARATPMRDKFARLNGCQALSIEPQAAAVGIAKAVYNGCNSEFPTTWVVFDGPHTPAFRPAGSNSSFSPTEVWGFLSQFQSKNTATNGSAGGRFSNGGAGTVTSMAPQMQGVWPLSSFLALGSILFSYSL